MSDLTHLDLLELELDTAWQAFFDKQSPHDVKPVMDANPAVLKIVEVGYKHGYVDGMRSVLREKADE